MTWRRRRLVAFRCPRCGRVSYHRVDIEQGYCAACHDWTRAPSPLRRRQLDAELERHGVHDPRPTT